MGRRALNNNKYREKLEERHGKDILQDFDSTFTGDITLAVIARKYKISKMRASQIFEKLYGQSFRKAKSSGSAQDPGGVLRVFECGESKQFVATIPEELYNQLKAYSVTSGLSMSAIARDCIADFFSKDGLAKLSKIF